MRYFILYLLLSLCAVGSAFSQTWRDANTKLELSRSTGYYVTVGHLDRYKKIPCIFVNRDGQLQKGFKAVLVHNGQYIDDDHTFRVFYNERKRRVRQVERFYFTK